MNIFHFESTQDTNEEIKEKEINEDEMYIISDNKKIQKEKKFMGRKKNRGKKDINGDIIESGDHNEYSFDNLIKKIRTIIINEIMDFVNKKIINKEGEKKGIFKNILMKMNQEQIINVSAKYNKYFLTKTIGEMLSEKVTKRVNYFPEEHNKIIIQKLSGKYEDLKILFSIPFLDCLKYFRGEIIEKQEYIEGMKKYSQIENYLIKKKDGNYADYLYNFLKIYEDHINNQRSRTNKKKKE